jgi:predicted ATP-grasp superfamily ATP-dependent carboligase
VVHYLETAQPPVLLKPIYSDLPGRAVAPMVLCHTKQELLARYDAVEDPAMPNLMLQEFIPGGDEMTFTFNGYFDGDGGCKVAFTGRRLRNYLPYFGQASLGICVHNDEVAKTAIDFMKAIGYRGPLDSGTASTPATAATRSTTSIRGSAPCSACSSARTAWMSRALYKDMTGQPVLASGTQEGRKWIVEDCDWVSALRYCHDGRLTLKGWHQSLRGVNETSYLAFDDPWPVAGAIAMDVRGLFNHWCSPRRPGRVPASATARVTA